MLPLAAAGGLLLKPTVPVVDLSHLLADARSAAPGAKAKGAIQELAAVGAFG